MSYLAETFLRVGECAQGRLEFPAVPEVAELSGVRYENSLADRAEWQLTR